MLSFFVIYKICISACKKNGNVHLTCKIIFSSKSSIIYILSFSKYLFTFLLKLIFDKLLNLKSKFSKVIKHGLMITDKFL